MPGTTEVEVSTSAIKIRFRLPLIGQRFSVWIDNPLCTGGSIAISRSLRLS